MPERKPPTWAWLGLLAVLVFDIWWRGHTIGPTVAEHLGFAPWPVVKGASEPLDCDEALFGVIGRRLVAGDAMYRDLTDTKPPLGYWLHALAVWIGGATETTIRLVPVPLALGTIVLVWWVALRLGGPVTASLAAFLYALLSTDPYMYGNGDQLEQAMNLFGMASLALVLAALGRKLDGRCRVGQRSATHRERLSDGGLRCADPPYESPHPEGGRGQGEGGDENRRPASEAPRASSPRRGTGLLLLGAGVCLGLGCLVKQVMILDLLVFGIVLLAGRGEGRSPGRRLGDVLVLAVGLGLVGAVAAGVLAAQGALPDAINDIFGYGRALATDVAPEPGAPPLWMRWVTGNADPQGHLPWPFGKTTYLIWWGSGTWPLWLASIPAIGWLLRGPAGTGRRLVGFWTLAAWVQVAMPRLFWAHYYLLPTPGVAVAVAVLLADSVRATRRGPGVLCRAVGLMTVLVVLAAIVGTTAIQVRDYLLVPAEEITERFKMGRQWIVLREFGRELGRRTEGWNNARMFVWGYHSPLAFYSGRDSVTRQVFADNFIRDLANWNHPQSRPRIERTLKDLRAHPPDLIFVGYPPFAGLHDILLEGYIPTTIEVEDASLPPLPYDMGLWVERSRYEAFVRSVRPVSGPAPPARPGNGRAGPA